jgi:hypothetical protein
MFEKELFRKLNTQAEGSTEETTEETGPYADLAESMNEDTQRVNSGMELEKNDILRSNKLKEEKSEQDLDNL